MPQLKAQVPDPLREHLPKLLARGGVPAPSGRDLVLDLHPRERTRTHLDGRRESHDIGRSECFLWQGREEQLIDDLATRGADRSREGGRRMRGDDHPDAWSCRSQQQIRAVKERTTGSRGADG